MTDRFSPSVKIEHAQKFSAIVELLNKGRFDESAALLRQHRGAMANMAGAMNSQMYQIPAASKKSHTVTDSAVTPDLPPEDLRWRVAGHRDAQLFWDTGALTVANIQAMLAIIGKSTVDYPRALDFGCGCGRVLLHMRDIAATVELHGTDIDAESIAWCQAHIPWANSVVNPWRPPLPFPDGHFDLVFNQSVFTHLDEDYQDVWLQELMRVTKPGAAIVLSVAGEGPFAELVEAWGRTSELAARHIESFRSTGFVYVSSDGWNDGPFPDFYHSTFHAPWYIYKHWGRYFDVKAHVVSGSLRYLDYLLLIRREGSPVPAESPGWELTESRELASRKAMGSKPRKAYRRLKRLAASMLRQR